MRATRTRRKAKQRGEDISLEGFGLVRKEVGAVNSSFVAFKVGKDGSERLLNLCEL